MKVRSGFVTNSSSSSFIVGIKNDIKEESMSKFLKYMFEGEMTYGSTKDQIEEFLLYEYGYDTIEDLRNSSSYLAEMYDNMIIAINNNMKIINISAEYDEDEYIKTMIEALDNAGVAKLIQEEY